MSNLDLNDLFRDACVNGDAETVKQIIDSVNNFNVEITDNFGRSALRLAVENENLEVVNLLLPKSKSKRIRDALLSAIYLGHTDIVETIVNHSNYKIFMDKKLLDGAKDSFWQTPSSDDAQFSPDITPIMLAAHCDHTDIVQMLLLNGDRIEKPHFFYCTCTECCNKFEFDSLRFAQSRLNAYKGLASESYISLASIDPILTAFELGRELRFLSEEEKYFKNEYLKLAENLSKYTVKLLTNVRGRDELEIVLNKTGLEHEERFSLLARLDLAIKYEEMPFVAHSNCQQKLMEVWYTGIRKITKMNRIITSIFYLCVVFGMPIFSIAYIISPNTRIGTYMRQPFIKFISFITSHVVLVILVILNSFNLIINEPDHIKFSNLYPTFYPNFTSYVNNINLVYRFEVDNFYIRILKPTIFDITISIWIIGLIINEIKEIFFYGLKNYLSKWTCILDAFSYILFLVSFFLKFFCMLTILGEMKKLEDMSFWTKVNKLEPKDLINQIEVFKTFYWLNSDRFYWFSFDPINLSEGLFAIATLLSFCKLLFFLSANQNLGPLQIAIGRMIRDVFKFMCIFSIIFCGFLFGLTNLYNYYESDVRRKNEIEIHLNDNNSTTLNAEIFFGTIDRTLLTMFWSIFLIGNPEAVKLDPFQNKLTVIFGYIIFGLFHVTIITILLNMLIAMMTRSYEEIAHHSDIEWKFSRSKLYMEFIKDGLNVPVPFNIIPIPYYVYKNIRNLIDNKIYKRQNSSNVPNIKISEFLDEESTIVGLEKQNENSLSIQNIQAYLRNRKSIDGEKLTYRKVIERMVKRFYLHNSREKEVREKDLSDLKQEFQTVKYEIIKDLKKAKMDSFKFNKIIHNGISVLGDFIIDNENKFNKTKDENENSEDWEYFKRFQMYGIVRFENGNAY